MEIFNELSAELQGMVMHHLFHTRAQGELFHSLPPDLQRKVITNDFTSDDVHASYDRISFFTGPHSFSCYQWTRHVRKFTRPNPGPVFF